MATILCLDDEPAIGLILQDTLERAGHEAISAHNVPQALQSLTTGTVDLIISDYRMPGLTGLEFLALLRQEGYETPLIMLTGYGSIEHAVAAIKAGAIDYITKPVRPEQLELAVNQALEVVRLRRENERLRREVMEFRNERQIIGDSPAIRRVLQTVATAAPTRARGDAPSVFGPFQAPVKKICRYSWNAGPSQPFAQEPRNCSTTSRRCGCVRCSAT